MVKKICNHSGSWGGAVAAVYDRRLPLSALIERHYSVFQPGT